MAELIAAVASWQSLALALFVFGFAPGAILRLLVKLYPKDDPRRLELLAELYQQGRMERLLFVSEQLETVLFEGLPHRIREMRRATRREVNETGSHTEVISSEGVTHRARVSMWTAARAHWTCSECSNADKNGGMNQ